MIFVCNKKSMTVYIIFYFGTLFDVFQYSIPFSIKYTSMPKKNIKFQVVEKKSETSSLICQNQIHTKVK